MRATVWLIDMAVPCKKKGKRVTAGGSQPGTLVLYHLLSTAGFEPVIDVVSSTMLG